MTKPANLKLECLCSLLFAALQIGPGASPAWSEPSIDLSGTWRFQLDEQDRGLRESWQMRRLEDTIPLPGTTDQAGKGYALDHATMTYGRDMTYSKFPSVSKPKQVDRRGFLVREHYYIGPAWYQRDLEIPSDWGDKRLRLELERVIWQSRVWVDDREAGSRDSLAAPHVYDLGVLKPGRHTLTIRIDNRMIHNTGTIGHAYGPETQTRWNGVVGRIALSAQEPVWIDDLQVYPDAAQRNLSLKIRIGNATGSDAQARLEFWLEGVDERSSATLGAPAEGATFEKTLELPPDTALWDEFNPQLYTICVALNGGEPRRIRFGLRDIERKGRHILVNGKRVFMRGTIDCAVYPKTGHPPVTLEEWRRVLGVLKEYGFNHVRFHSWCPPEAAFEAADELGLYLQPETMFWVDGWTMQTYSKPEAFGRDPDVLDFIVREMDLINKNYGNHPSFAMFSIGNEFSMHHTDWDAVKDFIARARAKDPRHLYTGCAARKPVSADDFWVAHDTGRGTRGVGPAHTDWDFDAAMKPADLPVISHETGQRPVFPDYESLLPKFTGPLKPYNLERLYREMKAAGLADRNMEFERASARFQYVQYKAEHEGLLRTADSSGYQLLMLNDFTGQSEALVGILDPFYESKGVVTAEEVSEWNSAIVPLARFGSFVWQAGDSFEAELELAQYGAADLEPGTAHWRIARDDGRVFAEGELEHGRLATGGLRPMGRISVPLKGFDSATALRLTVEVGGRSNDWPLWVYPSGIAAVPDCVHIARRFDDAAQRVLAEGGRVLLLTHGRNYDSSSKTGYLSAYWSAGWWGDRFSSLGICCDPKHPALAAFPNDGHSDWQWESLTKGATTFDLTESCPGLKPIVQPVTDFHFNRLLAQVFEFRVGKGSLLVCGYPLENNLKDKPAVCQFRNSLLEYMAGPDFSPDYDITADKAAELFAVYDLGTLQAEVVSVSSAAPGHGGENVLDGNADTVWHTPWGVGAPAFPHELVLKLPERQSLKGLVLLPRQDGNENGWIKDVEILLSDDGEKWSDPAARATMERDKRPKRIIFRHAGTDQGLFARYIKIRALSGFDDQPFASLAGVGLIREDSL